MKPFTTLTSIAAPLPLANLDTERLIPARFLRQPRSAGYHNYLFHDLREQGDFILDRPVYKGARIIVGAENFGCGSSREGAVWALAGAGYRAWIAPSFGDIFFDNSFKNGALPIILPKERVAALRTLLTDQAGAQLSIDLAAQTVTLPDGSIERFEVDPFRKECLLNGWDEIDLTLQHTQAITDFEARQGRDSPWLVSSA